jgi:hypothetical protein
MWPRCDSFVARRMDGHLCHVHGAANAIAYTSANPRFHTCSNGSANAPPRSAYAFTNATNTSNIIADAHCDRTVRTHNTDADNSSNQHPTANSSAGSVPDTHRG